MGIGKLKKYISMGTYRNPPPTPKIPPINPARAPRGTTFKNLFLSKTISLLTLLSSFRLDKNNASNVSDDKK